MFRIGGLAGSILLASSLSAQAVDFTARLIGGGASSDPLLLAVEITLAPGFETYWRSTGQFGAPPTFDWDGSENVAAVDALFPSPLHLDAGGPMIAGYAGTAVIPIELRRIDPARPARLRLAATYTVCRDICVEEVTRFDLTVPRGGAANGDEERRVAAARARVPERDAAWLRASKTSVGGGRLTVDIEADRSFVAPDIFIEQSARLIEGVMTFVVSADRRHAHVAILTEADQQWSTEPLTLTIVDDTAAAELTVPLGPASP